MAESFGYNVVSFAIDGPRSLSDRRDPFRPSVVAQEKTNKTYVPDGVRADHDGRLFVGVYEGGGVMSATPEGKPLARILTPATYNAISR